LACRAGAASLGIGDLRNFHNKQYRPENAARIVVGATDAATLLPPWEAAFGARQKGGSTAPQPGDAAPRAVCGSWTAGLGTVGVRVDASAPRPTITRSRC
jgi:hypothetical protein